MRSKNLIETVPLFEGAHLVYNNNISIILYCVQTI